ncbi:MAG: glycosyltransferase family 4 protein [Chloroflexota bacterium]
MHVLMISMDTSILTQQIGNSRVRHEAYAAQVGRVSVVICNRRSSDIVDLASNELYAYPTQSRSYLHYLLDGYRIGLRIAAEQPIDLIATQDPFLTALIGLTLRRRLHVPLIMQDHSSLVENRYFARERPRHRALQLLARQTLPRADAVRVVNHCEQAACIHLGIDADRVCVIPVAPDIGRFLEAMPEAQLAVWRTRLNLSTDSPVVLWVGRVVPVKNIRLLLEAFAQLHAELPEVHLVLAGAVSETHILTQVESLGLTEVVRLPGAVAHADLPVLYQIATVYAHSSNYEGFGLVLTEAAASGLPVISTATDGAREIVHDGETGLLTPIGDSVALAQALAKMLRDPQRGAMSEKARQHVQREFDEARLMAQWVAMWRAVATGESPCVS